MECQLMLSAFLKNLSILQKFLFINLIIFLVVGFLTVLYIGNVKPNLIKNKTTKHIQIIDNTIDHILRLNIKFEEEDVRRFLFSTRFLFQNLDRVILFDNQFNLVGDTDTLDLDPRSFSNRLDIVQLEILNEETSKKIIETKNINITIPMKIAVLNIKVFLSFIADLISLAFSEIAKYPILFPSNVTFLTVVSRNLSWPSSIKVNGFPYSFDHE